MSQLVDTVPDIAAFYRIFNNVPWEIVKAKESIHFFRAGVKPLWEDPENVDGGCLVIKVRREEGKAIRAWEEICLMCCGGQLQAAVTQGKSSNFEILHADSCRTRPYPRDVVLSKAVLGAYLDMDETGREPEKCRAADTERAVGTIL